MLFGEHSRNNTLRDCLKKLPHGQRGGTHRYKYRDTDTTHIQTDKRVHTVQHTHRHTTITRARTPPPLSCHTHTHTHTHRLTHAHTRARVSHTKPSAHSHPHATHTKTDTHVHLCQCTCTRSLSLSRNTYINRHTCALMPTHIYTIFLATHTCRHTCALLSKYTYVLLSLIHNTDPFIPPETSGHPTYPKMGTHAGQQPQKPAPSTMTVCRGQSSGAQRTDKQISGFLHTKAATITLTH